MIHRAADPAFYRAHGLLEPVGNVAVGHALIVGERNALALLATQMFETMPEPFCLHIVVPVILLIAFAPHWLGTPLHEGTSVTRGIPIGIGVIVISFLLTGVYVWRANGEFDRLNKAVLQEVKAS